MTPKQEILIRLAREAMEDLRGYRKGIDVAIAAIDEALTEPEEKYQYGTPLLDAMTGKTEQPAHVAAVNTSPERVDKTAKNVHEQPAQQECNHCGGTGDVSGEYPGVACPKCNGSGTGSQPEFVKHEVEHPYDWSEWVCPNPESYLMKCCDCGLVHEAQFRVAKYQPSPSDECEVANDPDLLAQFRMRRSEQWSPKDMAYRPGGLPLAEERKKYESLVRQLEDAKTLSSDPTPLLNEAFKERLAQAIEQMPFGDTATSFAVYIRNFK